MRTLLSLRRAVGGSLGRCVDHRGAGRRGDVRAATASAGRGAHLKFGICRDGMGGGLERGGKASRPQEGSPYT